MVVFVFFPVTTIALKKLQMRSLILIFVYLSKDILKRWLETPGCGFCPGFDCDFFVPSVFSFCRLVLSLTEKAVEKKDPEFWIEYDDFKIDEISKTEVRPSLDELLSSLGRKWDLFPLFLPFCECRTYRDKKRASKVVIYNESCIACA